jgi:hypothetical protein
MAFTLSVLALVLGPFVYAVGRRRPNVRQLLDGFIFITIVGIVCVHIVPEAIATGGLPTVAFLAIGLLFPVLVERQFARSLREAHVFILLLAALGLALHATIDGIALLPLGPPANSPESPDHTHRVTEALFDSPLALGVILHRLPVGMAIWWSVRPHFGVPTAIATFILIIAATAVAYFFGAPVVELTEARSLAYFQAFVAGSLVHVIAFGVSHDHGGHIEPVAHAAGWSYRTGILLGMFLVFTVPNVYA